MVLNLMDKKDESRVDLNHSDFSIDHILNRAGTNVNKCENIKCDNNDCDNNVNNFVSFPWVHCTRYCPPRIPRNNKKEGPQKRQLGRHPRIPFTSYQLAVLEEKFQQSPYLSSEEVIKLSRQLDLADIRVKIWFQNRRARERRERSQPKQEPVESLTVPQEITPSPSSNNLPPPQSPFFWIPYSPHLQQISPSTDS